MKEAPEIGVQDVLTIVKKWEVVAVWDFNKFVGGKSWPCQI